MAAARQSKTDTTHPNIGSTRTRCTTHSGAEHTLNDTNVVETRDGRAAKQNVSSVAQVPILAGKVKKKTNDYVQRAEPVNDKQGYSMCIGPCYDIDLVRVFARFGEKMFMFK